MMKRSVILFFAFFPLFAVAQNGAVAMLDKAVAVIKSDAAVQMDYDYTVYDDDDVIVYSDNGTMRLDNDRYSLIMENMKVWCNGKVQWSYMKDIDESMEKIAGGSFNVSVDQEFAGDFKNIRLSLNNLTDRLSLSMQEISDFLNFYNLPYFYKVFRDVTGLTPLQYRMEHGTKL